MIRSRVELAWVGKSTICVRFKCWVMGSIFNSLKSPQITILQLGNLDLRESAVSVMWSMSTSAVGERGGW